MTALDALGAPQTPDTPPTGEDTTDPSTACERPWGERERAILDFEAHTHRYAGLKESQIRERFDVSATLYYLELRQLLDDARALAYSPVVVNRLRRGIQARRR